MDNLRLHTHVRHDAPYPVLVVAGEIDVFTAPLFTIDMATVPREAWKLCDMTKSARQRQLVAGCGDRSRAAAIRSTTLI